MLKIPEDMKVDNTGDARAMKLVSKKMKDRAIDSDDADFSLEIAADLDKVASSYLELAETPQRGVGAEFVQERHRNHSVVCPSLEKVDRVNTEASLDRLDLIHQNGVLNMALDAAESLKASNAAEQMIAHQMAAAHRLGFDFLTEAGNTRDAIEKSRLANTAIRLLELSQKAALAINKIRTGGQQFMTVQHVQVSDGGQAVINGSVQTGVNRK